MALNELQLPWLSQPQEAVELTPLAASADYLFALPDLTERIAGAAPTLTGSPGEVVRQFGRGRQFSGSVYAQIAGAPSQAFTALVVFELTTTSITTFAFTGSNSAGNAIQIRAESGALQIVCSDVVLVLAAPVGLQVGRTYCAVWAHDPAAGTGYIALDGRIVGTTTSTQGYTNRNVYRIGARGSSESPSNYQALHVRWPRLLPREVGAAISGAPWDAIYEPARILVPVSGGGAGPGPIIIPTLSLPRALNIGETTMRPAVTLSF